MPQLENFRPFANKNIIKISKFFSRCCGLVVAMAKIFSYYIVCTSYICLCKNLYKCIFSQIYKCNFILVYICLYINIFITVLLLFVLKKMQKKLKYYKAYGQVFMQQILYVNVCVLCWYKDCCRLV